ncbi:hypothetical protein BON30_20570 [Cystobacter ferrugineus]|uniref:Uncharacterized protein n=1 Tax=Cystobacter ferrugineus TaxID=83449 RepID=A0A1L9B8R0_9BACT|nr:hypothetical protein BON30_20570 [Cystobacter ferrugineus]
MCLASGSSSLAFDGPLQDRLLQAPQLSAPQRGSLAGQLAHTAFGPADVSRGAFSLPSAFSVPEDRGALLAPLFPTYSPDSGASEWGVGWRTSLHLERWRARGDLDYATDGLTSPWGRLVQGSDGDWYPQGLSTPVRVRMNGTSATAWLPDGSTWHFGGPARIDTPRGTFAWYLTEVVTVLGRRTRLEWQPNDSGQLFLQHAFYGGTGTDFQYRIELAYQPLVLPFVDYRSGTGLALDRRVSTVTVYARGSGTGIDTERWRYTLTHAGDGFGPAFYLEQVTQRFASGEQPPPTHYTYHSARERLLQPEWFINDRLDQVLTMLGEDAFQPERATLLDVDSDGLIDFEHAYDGAMVRQTKEGFVIEYLPALPANAFYGCRSGASYYNLPRHLAQMFPEDSAHPLPEDRAHQVVSLEFDASRGITHLVMCDRKGQALQSSVLEGLWELGANTRLVDLNRDQKPDLLRVDTGSFEVIPNISASGQLAFGAASQGALLSLSGGSYQPLASWVQDMNGDSLPDLVVRHLGGLAVWWAKGQFEFDPIAREYPLVNLHGYYVDPAAYAFHFMDGNRDGLTDVLLVAQGDVRLFMNSGVHLQEVDIPSLYYLGYGSTPPVVADFRGSGNTEVAFAAQGIAHGVALDSPETGLMASADDGRGTVLHFRYGRGPSGPEVRQRPAVLSALEVESSGYDTLRYDYSYTQPVHHSEGTFLVGYGTVERQDGTVTQTEHFLQGDTYAGLPSSSSQEDALTPGLHGFTSRRYEDAYFRDIPWKRLEEERSGWTGAQGELLEEWTEYPEYEADVCPATVVRHLRQGTLTTKQWRAQISGLANHLHCLEERVILSGAHDDSTLNFEHTARLIRDEVGLLKRVESIGDGQTLVLQEVGYRADHTVQSISQPGQGTTTFGVDPTSLLLSKVTSPDGTWVEVAQRDPSTDGMLSLVKQRGGKSYAQHFRYDGQERLKKQWNDAGRATEANPNMVLAYEFARAQRPGSIRVASLVDAGSGAHSESVEWQTAAGEDVTAAEKIPEGWAFNGITTRSRVLRETNTYQRDTEPLTLDTTSVTYADLLRGGQLLRRTRTAGFGHEMDALSRLHVDVERHTAGSVSFRNGLLQRQVLENGTHRRTHVVDAAERVVAYEDEVGTRYTYGYDALGRLRTVLLPDGKQHRVFYDKHGRVSRIWREDIATVDYTYAPGTGLLEGKRFLSPAGQPMREEAYAYDGIGRKTVETHTDPTAGTSLAYRFHYDGATPAQPSLRTDVGMLTAVEGDGFVKTFSYYPDGKEWHRTVQLNGWRTVETTWTYADNGDVAQASTAVRDSAGLLLSSTTLEHGWDTFGRLHTLHLNGQPLATFTYNAQGQPWRATFTTGETASLAYDGLSRKRTGLYLNSNRWTASTGLKLNGRGFLDTEDIVVNGRPLQRAYQYSPQGFLTQSTDADAAYLYGFDTFGLPTSITDNQGTRTLSRQGSTLTAGDITYTFDALGRTVTRGNLTLAYGPHGHLALARKGVLEWRFLHDEAGQRLMKLAGDTPVAAYLEGGMYLDETGLTQPFKFAGHVVGLVKNGSFEMLAADTRGSVIADVDGTPRLASPFGARDIHPSHAAAIDYVEKGFDADLGLIRMGVRDYDPGLNRFMTPDPLFLEQPALCADRPVECNLYGYAVGNPVTFVDPKGTAVETVWDVASLGMGIYSIRSWNENTSTFSKVVDVIGVVADAAAVVVPFVPGGAGAAIKGARAVDAAVDTLQSADKTVEAVQAAEKAAEVTKLVNIDTGTASAFVSQDSAIRHELKEFVQNKGMVMTETAAKEFQGMLRVAGPEETARAQRFLDRVTIIPDNPSSRALKLKETKSVGSNDIKIFGTGDNMGITTMSSDAKFLRGAKAQGVEFDAFLHSPVPLRGL